MFPEPSKRFEMIIAKEKPEILRLGVVRVWRPVSEFFLEFHTRGFGFKPPRLLSTQNVDRDITNRPSQHIKIEKTEFPRTLDP